MFTQLKLKYSLSMWIKTISRGLKIMRKNVKFPETIFMQIFLQTWPYIFQQVPDLNANKVSISSSKEIIKTSPDYTHLTASSDSLQKFTPYDDESNIRSVTHFTMYNDSRCHDDFEMNYDWSKWFVLNLRWMLGLREIFALFDAFKL